MALNPAFTSQTRRKLPFACGYVLGAGDVALTTTAQDGSQYALTILGEGEWDGPQLTTNGTANQVSPQHLRGVCVNDPPAPSGHPSFYAALNAEFVHFHSGEYSTRGAGFGPTSVGPDQGYDYWFPEFPTVTPPQCFSGIAYAIFSLPAPPTGFTRGTWTVNTAGPSCMSVWRSLRCRQFDAYGNVVSYGFTCNPAWHKVEAILRYKIRPQTSPLAGLTDAEKACFNWDSIYELAQRNDFLLPNGRPRFSGNYIFAADATLTNILEVMKRVDRSFMREPGGRIEMIGDDARASVFLMGANHVVPGSLSMGKKDVSKAANVYVPSYRDIDVPAVCQIINATTELETIDGVPLYTRTFLTAAAGPFTNAGYMTVGGCADASYDGDYYIADGSYTDPIGSTGFFTRVTLPTSYPASSTTGGFLGANDARFSPRSPTTVQHRSHQRMVAQQAPGLLAQPRVVPVVYDCGNSTYDQTNRLMKFERDRALGTDIGASWTAPPAGTVKAYLEVVDVNGNALISCQPHDVITLDDWVTPELTGDYEIVEIPEIAAPAGDDLGSITLSLMRYNPAAATDVGDAPGDSYATVPNSNFPLTGFAAVPNPSNALQATPAVVDNGDGTRTVTLPDLSLQVLGEVTPRSYSGFTLPDVPSGTAVLLYVQDAGGGATPVYGWQAGSGLLSSYPAGRYLVIGGTFA